MASEVLDKRAMQQYPLITSLTASSPSCCLNKDELKYKSNRFGSDYLWTQDWQNLPSLVAHLREQRSLILFCAMWKSYKMNQYLYLCLLSASQVFLYISLSVPCGDGNIKHLILIILSFVCSSIVAQCVLNFFSTNLNFLYFVLLQFVYLFISILGKQFLCLLKNAGGECIFVAIYFCSV